MATATFWCAIEIDISEVGVETALTHNYVYLEDIAERVVIIELTNHDSTLFLNVLEKIKNPFSFYS